jgi:SAM-dependent methyltransferase
MRVNFSSETEFPGTKANRDQLQIICHRYYFASKFVSEKEVLEVGCGPGLGLGYLSKTAKLVVGGDITQDSLRYAQEHYNGRVGLVSMDAHKLPFRDSCFDVVLCVAAIIYLDLHSFFDECYHVLKRGGVLILNTPNKDIPGFQESVLSNKYYSASDLFALLNSHHFDTELFGAFPISKRTSRGTQQKFLQAMARMVGKALNLMPKGEAVKKILNKSIFHATVLNNEIDDEMIGNAQVENIQLVPIPSDLPDLQHRILYIIATKEK